jgi:hypothetical protein
MTGWQIWRADSGGWLTRRPPRRSERRGSRWLTKSKNWRRKQRLTVTGKETLPWIGSSRPSTKPHAQLRARLGKPNHAAAARVENAAPATATGECRRLSEEFVIQARLVREPSAPGRLLSSRKQFPPFQCRRAAWRDGGEAVDLAAPGDAGPRVVATQNSSKTPRDVVLEQEPDLSACHLANPSGVLSSAFSIKAVMPWTVRCPNATQGIC